MKKNRSLGRKIQLAMIMLVIGMLLVASTIFGVTMRKAVNTLAASNETLTETIGQSSSAYMTEQSQTRMLELAAEKAKIADEIFFEFERGVRIVADDAAQIYNHPSLYAPRPVPLPDPSKDGELTIQVLYSAAVDPEDPAIVGELELIGNVQDTLMAVNASQDNIASLYVATESGFMVQADYIPAKKFDENGKLMPLEAKERPWYVGAAASGGPFFTPVTRDAHTPRLGIMCGVPVYRSGELVAVAGAGMYLDDMEDLVRSVNLGGSGNACILNGRGQVLFSTYESGALAAAVDAPDLRLSADAALADMAERAVGGGKGVTLLDVDGAPCYAAYAPMEAVGWSMVVFLPQEAVEAPTHRLLESINTMTETAFRDTAGYTVRAQYGLLALLAAAVLIALAVSVALSRQIVRPIRKLTEEVGAMQGDDLDFHWTLDTGDETQTLAEAFASLTQRMKDYIRENEAITAEKERIGTELSVATRIQAAMLPSIFPPFPERSDFDIYASMDPAREVGGDFYDFFLIDEDHLCLVIADVSGKGVPAALFMMASKIILQSCAMLGNSPAEILRLTNEAICSNNEAEMFITAWVGILELSTGKLTAANAGHEYPVLKRADGGFELLRDKHGLVLGGLAGQSYAQYELQLEKGAKLFLYTDGVPEANTASGEMFSLGRLLDALNAAADGTPEQILRGVRGALDEFVKDAEQFDDITMLCAEYKGR